MVQTSKLTFPATPLSSSVFQSAISRSTIRTTSSLSTVASRTYTARVALHVAQSSTASDDLISTILSLLVHFFTQLVMRWYSIRII
ncbi:hypothetical protein GALMADRAFT_258942 [Galerina marginata CBS 339.88]|uniref:Uncharacterized protein n=1 Tax=Galerina marginata (strain CBS 339.88) TaxID=685588 RepID=A0A067S7K6_GALM3|nr:hypothetical protein GALMADRAFT_258942 [Galerina marginata CBS 339.88]